jgi:predicted chitinase
MNAKKFYDQIRAIFFPNGLTQAQVDNIEHVLRALREFGVSDSRWIAYVLATVFHETSGTMLPVHEKGNREYFLRYDIKGNPKKAAELGNNQAGDGYKYRGRGFVQLTGKRNYQLFGDRYNIDLVTNPDLVIEPVISANVLVDGMVSGLFTGKSLDDCFPLHGDADWINARRIVNGTDKAQLIANYAQQFHNALVIANESDKPAPIPIQNPELSIDYTPINQWVTDQERPAPLPPSSWSPPVQHRTRPVPNPAPLPAPAPLVQTRDPWWLRALTSKIFWVNLITLVTGGGVFTLVDLTPEQRATVAELMVYISGGVTILLRIFFNNLPPVKK